MEKHYTLSILSVVPGQGETVARCMRLEAAVLHMSDPSNALNNVDFPELVHPMM